MNILMITPGVDKEDKNFGFVYYWILKLAEKVDKLYIITLRETYCDLPSNVEVFNVDSKNKISKVFKFYRYIWQIFDKIDIIFCHMYPEFTFLSYSASKLFSVPIVTWYSHTKVNLRLKLVNIMARRIVTTTRDTCRLKSKKVIPIGHGINTDFFKLAKKREERLLLTIGRISPIKHIETMIGAMENLKDCRLLIVGDAPKRDEDYLIGLKKQVKNLGLNNVEFHKGISFRETVKYYQNASIFIHCSDSGLDKTGLEAMSTGLPIISCCELYKEFLKDFPTLTFEEQNVKELTTKIERILSMSEEEKAKLSVTLRNMVMENHNVNSLMNKLVKVFEGVG